MLSVIFLCYDSENEDNVVHCNGMYCNHHGKDSWDFHYG